MRGTMMPDTPKESPVQPVRRTRRDLWIAVGLFLATLALFSRAWPNDFVNYDDPDYVTANAHVRQGLTPANAAWAFSTGDVSYWHPLTWLSHMADWTLYGANPHGHHATSIVLHALNAAAAFLVLRRLTGRMWLSALAAALFAWHPLRVESVAWISERKDVLSGLFSLATLGVYAGYASRRELAGRSAWRWYVGALLLFCAGLMSKPMVVTLPGVLLVLDFWPLRRMTRGTVARLLLEKLPFVALSAVVAAVTVVAQRNVGTLTDVLPLDARLANAVVSVARYLGRIFAPHDLAVLYPHPGHWAALNVILAVVLFVVLTAGAVLQRRRRPWLLAGWLWFLVALLPASGVVQVGIQSMADRYTYLPAIGIVVAVLWTLGELSAPLGGKSCIAAAGMTLASLAALTWNQLSVWTDSLTLFHHTVSVAGKGNYLAYNNRGVALFHAGRIDDAAADYERSLAINPEYPESNNNYGEALARKGRRDEAIGYYRKAVRLGPKLVEAHNNLANALADGGAFDEAIKEYEIALKLRPNDALVLNNFGAGLGMAGRLPESYERLQQAARIQPDYPGLQANIGNVLAMMGRAEEAEAQYRRAIAMEPTEARSYFNLGFLLLQKGRPAEAVSNLQRAIELAGPNPDGCAVLGRALIAAGRSKEGIERLREALRLRPEFPQARAWLDEATAGGAR